MVFLNLNFRGRTLRSWDKILQCLKAKERRKALEILKLEMGPRQMSEPAEKVQVGRFETTILEDHYHYHINMSSTRRYYQTLIYHHHHYPFHVRQTSGAGALRAFSAQPLHYRDGFSSRTAESVLESFLFFRLRVKATLW